MNNDAMNILVHIFGNDLGAFPLGGFLRVEMVDHRVYICSTLTDTAKSFSKVSMPIYTPSISLQKFSIYFKNRFFEVPTTDIH